MSLPDQIAEIFDVYRKHGWILRRVLVKKSARKNLGALDPEILILESDVEAAWFSRPPKPGGIAWEIRYLGEPPFALLENLDEAEDDFEEKLQVVESRLKISVTSKKGDPPDAND